MFEFRVTQLVSAQPAEGAVQPEQLQGVAVQPMANQETREARRQEEQGADVSLVEEKKDRRAKFTELFLQFYIRGGPAKTRRTARISDT